MKQILQSKTKTTKNVQHIHINTKEIVQSVFFMLLYFSTTDAEERLVSLSQWPLPLWWQKPRPPNVQAVGKQWEQPPPCKYHQLLTQWSAGQTPQSLSYQGLGSTRRQATETETNKQRDEAHQFTQLPIFPLFCILQTVGSNQSRWQTQPFWLSSSACCCHRPTLFPASPGMSWLSFR